MTTDSHKEFRQVSREIPANARQFQDWLDRQDQTTWPADLRDKAQRALLVLKTLDQKAAWQSKAMQSANKQDLQAFADAYRAVMSGHREAIDPQRVGASSGAPEAE